MNTLEKIVIVGSLALGGCLTAKDKCENNIPEVVSILGMGGSCDKISNKKAVQECNDLIKKMRESAMSACLTLESGIATVCTEAGEGFDCVARE